MKPLVSIIIPVYNGSNYIEQAIKSALNQTYQNCEVIVVNDGSNDEGKTDSIAKTFGSRIAYYVKENGGVASAINYGIQRMNGEYFSWLSHDDYYYPQKMQNQIDFLKATNKKICFASYDLVNQTTNTNSYIKSCEWYDNRYYLSPIFNVMQCRLNFCTAIIHKSVFDEYGLFDGNLRYVQDSEMVYRLSKNYDIGIMNERLVGQRVHPQSDQVSRKDVFFKESREWLAKIIADTHEEDFENSYYTYNEFLISTVAELISYEEYSLAENLQNKIKPIKLDIDNINTIFKAKRVVIFGAGQMGIKVYYVLKNYGINIYRFCDNASQKWGTHIDGVECVAPATVAEIKEDICVVVATRCYYDMILQLKEYGIDNVIASHEAMGKVMRAGKNEVVE